ncbi:hypothetical protein [Arthrobacter sp. ZGTC131]|uniref:hypothetical protein n=1 Tax=Arthrobacter sp. ZGTC131 TaxID=2058898 RepID=UPI000CE4013F|nr:hypothetical protein [Arthrobacter sp. ZGTC131]
MAFFDRVFGRTTRRKGATPGRAEDEIAVERYQQVLSNAPTDKIEQAHLEAFAKLTPAQLDVLFERFTKDAPTPDDRPADARPDTLARAAARAERRQPGTLTRTLGEGNNVSAGRSVLQTVAGYVIATEIVSAYFYNGYHSGASGAAPAEASGADGTGDSRGDTWGGGSGDNRDGTWGGGSGDNRDDTWGGGSGIGF